MKSEMTDKKQQSNATIKILSKINEQTKLGDLRKIAKEIKKDHTLALELWSTSEFKPRQLAILIMDKNQLDEVIVDQLVDDMSKQSESEQIQLMDWLFANQLSKSKELTRLIESWRDSNHPLQRRTYWYLEGRKRWMGNTPPDNSDELLFLLSNIL